MNNFNICSSRMPSRLKGFSGIALALALAACSSGNNDNNFIDIVDDNAADVNPFQELIDQGAGRYLGTFTPMVTESVGDVVAHRFSASGDGPMCLRGGEYVMSTRDTGSDELVIFLQGGGGCWGTLCAATEDSIPGVLSVGILDQKLAGNPVADWNVAYLPYCDGGVHASDAEYDIDENGLMEAGTSDQFHHGLQNMSAALDVTVQTFPAPKRILLTGVSGGGFGTIFALPLVRTLYPGVPIEVVNDSGVAVGRPNDPEFFENLLDYWNIGESFLPASCPDCIADDGHATGILDWAMQRDDNLRVSLLSYKQDTTISTFFFAVGGEIWEPELIREMAEAEAAQPDRLRTMIANGSSHTFLLANTDLEVDGISVMDWVAAMLNDSPEWTSRID